MNTVFIATLIIVALNWKQSKCLSTNEWVNKLWYINTMECYSATKRNEYWWCFIVHEPQKHAKWEKLDTRDHILILFIWNLIYKGRKEVSGSLGLWVAAGINCKPLWRKLLGDGNILKLNCSDCCSTL